MNEQQWNKNEKSKSHIKGVFMCVCLGIGCRPNYTQWNCTEINFIFDTGSFIVLHIESCARKWYLPSRFLAIKFFRFGFHVLLRKRFGIIETSNCVGVFDSSFRIYGVNFRMRKKFQFFSNKYSHTLCKAIRTIRKYSKQISFLTSIDGIFNESNLWERLNSLSWSIPVPVGYSKMSEEDVIPWLDMWE